MKLRELIQHLQTFDPDLDVVYRKWSEYKLVDPAGIEIVKACYPREDGWVHDERPDKPSQQYLCITY